MKFLQFLNFPPRHLTVKKVARSKVAASAANIIVGRARAFKLPGHEDSQSNELIFYIFDI
jgi:hypothetical protein